MRQVGANPGRGSNSLSLKAGSILLEAREGLARLFHIDQSSRLAFTLNITEALNIGLKGLLKPGDHVITSSMEHNAVARPLHRLSQTGVEWTPVQCSPEGFLDPQDVARAIKGNTRMICLLHASNLTGTIMPLAEIGRIAREHGLIFMVDSAQTAGVLPIDVDQYHIDVLTFTGHKGLLGPQGTGGLYLRSGLSLTPLKEGGTGSLSQQLEQPDFMPDALESGTLNTPGISGLKAAVEFILSTGIDTIRDHEARLTGHLLDGLQEVHGVTVYGPKDSRRATAVVSFNIEGMDCGEVSLLLDQKFGIISRSGLHCAPLGHQTMGTIEMGTCRLSPGFFTTEEEIDRVVQAVSHIASLG
jgi:cysteine desulfurase family protein